MDAPSSGFRELGRKGGKKALHAWPSFYLRGCRSAAACHGLAIEFTTQPVKYLLQLVRKLPKVLLSFEHDAHQAKGQCDA